ncbi:MAG: hypothetical protein ISS71_05970 [Phycisphaerae bacterium]|nr:hypothetical protein [Phycisphaerae bacterium]
MSEESAVTGESLAVIDEDQSLPDVSGTEKEQNEKRVPVGEAIRYRKRAQAAEKELSELKESHENQDAELAQLKEQVQGLENTVKQTVTPEHDNHKTQGVKETRTGGARSMLQTAAKQAAGSGSRSDVQEYLRLRRNFV